MAESLVPNWSLHTRWSDPGDHAGRLRSVPTDPDGLGEVARNLIAHYRAFAADLPDATRGDIHSRWLATILGLDAARHPEPLDVERPLPTRVQGCCRDHSLFAIGVLREHGIAARSRIGFADYFIEGFNVDHVIVEYADPTDGGRWRRFDPELWPSLWAFDRLDMPSGVGFRTAAEVWTALQAGQLDPMRFGVAPGIPDLAGREFVGSYVLYELAHRHGDELLLWDNWGEIDWDGALDEALVDQIAAGLLAADAGDDQAEADLALLYRSDPRLHPGTEVTRADPWGGPPVVESLAGPAGQAG